MTYLQHVWRNAVAPLARASSVRNSWSRGSFWIRKVYPIQRGFVRNFLQWYFFENFNRTNETPLDSRIESRLLIMFKTSFYFSNILNYTIILKKGIYNDFGIAFWTSSTKSKKEHWLNFTLKCAFLSIPSLYLPKTISFPF